MVDPQDNYLALRKIDLKTRHILEAQQEELEIRNSDIIRLYLNHGVVAGLKKIDRVCSHKLFSVG
jgi:hypothetical protein